MKRSILGLFLLMATAQGKCFAQEETPDTLPPLKPSRPVLTFTEIDSESKTPASESAKLSCASCALCASCEPLAPKCERPVAANPGTGIWGSADYLLWWTRKGGSPPLVVTGSPTDPFPGALDQPGTRVLFGADGLDYGALSGLRLDLGVWLDREHLFGVEAGGFVLQQGTVRYHASGDANGQPFLATPFVNANTGNQNVYFISQNFANPNLSAMLTGSVGVVSTTNLWSWEINEVTSLIREQAWSLNMLLGFRQVSLKENLGYTTTVTNLAPGGASEFLLNPIAPGSLVTTNDAFATSNTFNGGQLGTRWNGVWGPLTLEVITKLALGSMHESLAIQGGTSTNAPLPVTQAVGGIYAQSTNIGTQTRDVFAVIPEVGVNLGLRLSPNINIRAGYTFFYLSRVLRPGDQIDTQINTNLVPIDPNFGAPGGPNRPGVDMHGTSFWAQGVNCGLEITF